MVCIPRLCDKCQSVYWSDSYGSFHMCQPEKEEEDDDFYRPPPKKKKEKVEKPSYNHACKTCQQEFKSGHKHRVYCSEICSRKGENAKKIKAANEKWLNPTPRKKPKYSFSQLNRMAEWKRLHDDESWTKRFNAKRG